MSAETPETPSRPDCSLSVGVDGRLLASGGLTGTVRLWDPRSASSAGQGAPRGQLLATLRAKLAGCGALP
jgi:hypothetical protein